MDATDISHFFRFLYDHKSKNIDGTAPEVKNYRGIKYWKWKYEF